jgi:CBS domain-containing protein
MQQQEAKGIRLSQAAPILPTGTAAPPTGATPHVYGVSAPVSSASIPSVYGKKIGNLFRGRLVTLPHDFPLGACLEKISYYNITSVPVLKRDFDQTVVLGFIDTLDILSWLVKLATGQDTFGDQPPKMRPEDFDTLVAKTEEFKNTPIGDIVGFSKRNPFHVLHADTSLQEAVEFYLKGIHRIAIVDDKGEMTGVLSQWTIANYLATVPTDDKEWIPTYKIPISQNPLITKNLITCSPETSVMDAFLLMNFHQLSAIAICDSDGRLVGNLSASDLKGLEMFERDLSALKKPVLEFVNNIRQLQGRPENFLAFCLPHQETLSIIRKMNKEIVHRVYIVDSELSMKPLGVASITDMMKGFVVKNIHTAPVYASVVVQTQPEHYRHVRLAQQG